MNAGFHERSRLHERSHERLRIHESLRRHAIGVQAVRRGALLLAILFLSAAVSALAADPPALSNASKGGADESAAWDESAGLQVYSGDSLDAGARVFDSPDYQQQLLVPGKGGQAFVLGLKTQAVRLLPAKAIQWTQEGNPVPDVSAATDGGSFQSDAGVVTFTVGAQSWKLQPKPPLVGPVTLDALRDAEPDYVYAASRITPDPAAVQALKNLSDPVHLVVFFGSWCANCKHWLPHLLKTLEVVSNPKITVEFIGMSEDQLEPKDAIRQYAVSSTPTIIALRGGKELGRIVEHPDDSIEGDLARIVGAH